MANPLFPVPKGTETVNVRIIDTTTRLGKLPLDFLMEPAMKGMQCMPDMPSWSFLIEHASGQKLLYDLGVPKAWRSLSPFILQILEGLATEISVENDVIDILKQDKIKADQISGIIWSHWHFDHVGDPSLFPPSTDLIVGPGFKDTFCPGYPASPDSPIRECDLAGRNLREIDFSEGTKTGRFPAFDFFGDGSFYLVDTPGHAVGHLGALARTTTNPDTFIFMGGDLCHHGGGIRPSKHMSIPSDLSATMPAALFPCPGAEKYEKLLLERSGGLDRPFFHPAPMVGTDFAETVKTIEKAQEADAENNIWFVSAHDPSLLGLVNLFPLKANDWKERKWREQTLWAFLRDFDEAIGVK
ncbi:unnamed protein product [Penicillium salamii]|uniref:Metallo-beta-lactamase domain-containing protein n=1 Tax=Penicillium salamii TaxID=1612424 RepID=A0A9W4JHJ0_9EURO|nr:unnamed protein product [Penicillium salamii]CAG8073706.1 unnamed protein product [Penicillium salamii]CAG8119648.1 unnamed protein product [Penicillium salamii]CAG8132866.1 unnamed protein product [Penicillium salamii]CAG8299464.1 unnamed protein product [Penicillium salamii]